MRASNRLFLVLLLCACFGQIYAQQPKEHIYLNDGSMYSGYVSRQDADNKIEFTADFGRVVTPDHLMGETTTQFYEFDEVDARWKEYAQSHNLTFKEGNVEGIRLIRGGICAVPFWIEAETDSTKTYVYFTQQHEDKSFTWEQISKLVYDPINTKKSNYIETVFELKDDKTIRGQMVAQELGKSICILSEGRRINKNLADIRSIKKELKDASQGFSELTPYLEQITGSPNTGWGVIIEKGEDGMVLQEKNGTATKCANADIKSISRKLNLEYAPIFLTENFTDSTVLVNSQALIFVKVEKAKTGDLYSFPEKYQATEVHLNAEKQVELQFVSGLKEKLVVFNAKPKTALEVKKSAKKSKVDAYAKPVEKVDSFDLHDMTDFKYVSALKTDSFDTLGVCRNTYKLEANRYYAVFDGNTQKAFMIKVVE